MKFENVKVGDMVFVEETVKNGFHGGESFYIPRRVTKESPTQFWVGDYRYFKKDGKRIGVYGEYAWQEGGNPIGWRNETVTDQTAEMEAFKQKIAIQMQLRRKLEGLKLDRNSEKSLDEMNEILALVEQLETKLK